MLSLLRHRFGIPGAIAVFALVFAMVGGAYAAKKYVITSTSQIKPDVLKSLKGKAGPAGPAGAAGAKGDTGAKGDAGAAGATGLQGPQGIQGPEGKKGKDGEDGEPGSPWVAGGTLPSESTETGTWGTFENSLEQQEGAIAIQISFPIPLEPSAEAGNPEPPTLAPIQKIYVGPEEDKSAQGCPGYVNGIPAAEPGKLCLYADQLVNAQRGGFNYSYPAYTPPGEGKLEGGYADGVGTSGTVFNITCQAQCRASGNWAVTAP